MSEITPITREETYLNAISEGGESGLSPITREEMYLSAIAGESDLPADMTPITRREMYLQKIYDNGGGGGGGEAEGTVEINITQNGTITRNVARYASAEITTNVPNPSTGTKEITANGDHDVTDYATAHVAVPQPSGSVTINSNGTHDVTQYASASVNVPNSYSASDEGKVVSNGALVGQTSRTVTSNGTVDTTLNDEVVVNVPTGITPSGSQTFTQNGTYDVSALAEAVVNVASSGGSGAQVVASGTFVGDDGYNLRLPVGTKFPQADFIVHIWLDDNAVIPYSASFVHTDIVLALLKSMGHFDLSTDGTKNVTTDRSAKVIGSNETQSEVNTMSYFGVETSIRNGAVQQSNLNIGWQQVIRSSDGFTLRVTKGTTQYHFLNGATYHWEVLYFGNDPTNDIVEVA